jgi:hypothetical protein
MGMLLIQKVVAQVVAQVERPQIKMVVLAFLRILQAPLCSTPEAVEGDLVQVLDIPR